MLVMHFSGAMGPGSTFDERTNAPAGTTMPAIARIERDSILFARLSRYQERRLSGELGGREILRQRREVPHPTSTYTLVFQHPGSKRNQRRSGQVCFQSWLRLFAGKV